MRDKRPRRYTILATLLYTFLVLKVTDQLDWNWFAVLIPLFVILIVCVVEVYFAVPAELQESARELVDEMGDEEPH